MVKIRLFLSVATIVRACGPGNNLPRRQAIVHDGTIGFKSRWGIGKRRVPPGSASIVGRKDRRPVTSGLASAAPRLRPSRRRLSWQFVAGSACAGWLLVAPEAPAVSGTPLPVLRVAETVPVPRLSPGNDPSDAIGTLISDDEDREAAAHEDSSAPEAGDTTAMPDAGSNADPAPRQRRRPQFGRTQTRPPGSRQGRPGRRHRRRVCAAQPRRHPHRRLAGRNQRRQAGFVVTHRRRQEASGRLAGPEPAAAALRAGPDPREAISR